MLLAGVQVQGLHPLKQLNRLFENAQVRKVCLVRLQALCLQEGERNL